MLIRSWVVLGGMSAYNTAPERLNAVETRAICNVPIESEALGDPVHPATGECDRTSRDRI
jgi:hypothetical protein